MKPFYLRNDNVEHEHRLFLGRVYAKRRGRRVYFCDILHELMANAVAEAKSKGE